MPRAPQHIEARFESALEARAASSALRSLSVGAGIDFCSNDYLGLARSSRLAEEILAVQGEMGVVSNGATGSRLISGNSDFAEKLEARIAGFHAAEAALLFSSGYSANIGLLSAIASRHDTILYDEYVHASIRDGIRLGFAGSFSFRHNDVADLERRLMRTRGSVFVVVESLYSMDGDIAPLREIAALCADYGGALIVDEAHAGGVFGESGAGIVPALKLADSVFARVYTFGKALGIHGAAVVGSDVLRRYLINFARSFIYTTAQPPHALAAIGAAYRLLPNLTAERKQVSTLSASFDAACERAGIAERVSAEGSPVKSILIPGNSAVQKVAEELRRRGFDVRAIRSPAVPAGKERLRVCLHAHNSTQEVESFITACAESLRRAE
ncbi:MAG: 8-amino-7-oxononanoate synthase [Deltaproteobacteria bacterium]|nr:8-amino-7-oxononanoate synthase [Deltaproteobacteria bacterium]